MFGSDWKKKETRELESYFFKKGINVYFMLCNLEFFPQSYTYLNEGYFMKMKLKEPSVFFLFEMVIKFGIE